MLVPQLIYIAIRTDNAPGQGDGSIENPYNGSTVAAFDGILRNLRDSVGPLPNYRIVLGRGVFRTNGGNGPGYALPSDAGWSPGAGWRISGSGIFSTVLRFIDNTNAQTSKSPRPAIVTSPDYLSSFELEDLTLDCNLQNMPFRWPATSP